MSIIPALQFQRQNYENRINNARNQIKSCERAYESLSVFKTIVLRSQEDFYTINSNKLSILSDLENIKTNSLTVQRYYSGMQNIFTGIGTKVVGVVYTVLLSYISARLRNYSDSIINYENDINFYEKRIVDIDRQIKAARKAEELAKLTSGG